MREHRQLPKRLRYGKFRKNLQEFKTRAETPVTAYHRKKVTLQKLLEESKDDIQSE